MEERWTRPNARPDSNCLLLIDAQTNTPSVVASPDLFDAVAQDLFDQHGGTPWAFLCGWGSRYRQASLEALNRWTVVLNGADDPGPPSSRCRSRSSPTSTQS